MKSETSKARRAKQSCDRRASRLPGHLYPPAPRCQDYPLEPAFLSSATRSPEREGGLAIPGPPKKPSHWPTSPLASPTRARRLLSTPSCARDSGGQVLAQPGDLLPALRPAAVPAVAVLSPPPLLGRSSAKQRPLSLNRPEGFSPRAARVS